MTLKKAIKHGKEHREEYRGAPSISTRCRHGGDCPICSGNRQFVGNKLKLSAAKDLLEDGSDEIAKEEEKEIDSKWKDWYEEKLKD